MRDRLKRLKEAADKAREAAQKAVEAARTGPADALRSATEAMLRRAASAGVPAEAATAGTTAVARLWTRVAPTDPMAHARLGEALVREGRYKEAVEELRKGAAAEGDAALVSDAWLARAEVLAGETGQAVARIERTSARLPAHDAAVDAQIRGVLASGALDAFRPGLAERVLGDKGEDPLRALARARLALVGGETEEARAQARHASTLGLPDEAAVWLGLVAAAEGDRKTAAELLAAAKTRGPDRAFAEAGLGWLRVVSGAEGAEPILKAAVERLPTHAGAMLLLGVVAERGGDPGEARRWYDKAGGVDPRWIEPWLGVVRTALATGDFEAARAAARRAGAAGGHRLLAGLAAALAAEPAAAEAAWGEVAGGSDRDARREVALLRAAVAFRLGAAGRLEAAAAAWQEVSRRASQAGQARHQVARWAMESAKRAMDAPQPAYYAVEAALAAAGAHRPQSEDLVVAHCSATFLARGPAAARTALERAVARGASDERVVGLLGLIDAATRGGPMPSVPLPRSTAAIDAAARARDGDAEGCIRLLDDAMNGNPPPAVRAVVGGARALCRLASVMELLRSGRYEEAVQAMAAALEHLPSGVDRDRVLHDLAAVCTVAARRLDEEARSRGEPPPEGAVLAFQAALRYWVQLGAASAYWADLSRQVLELDDPRLTPRDVDALRAGVHGVAASGVASLGREALAAGQALRARAFLALLLGAPVSDEARRAALAETMSPLTTEASSIAEAARRTAVEADPRALLSEYQATLKRVHDLQGRLADAAPSGLAAAADARDELALGLVAFFENLHDRAGELRAARSALAEAAAVAGSETLRAELEGKVARMEGRA